MVWAIGHRSVSPRTANVRVWLASEVRTTSRLRPNHPQLRTFAIEFPLSRFFFCCTFRCGPPGEQCWTAACDPGCVKTPAQRSSAQQLDLKGNEGKSLLRLKLTSRINISSWPPKYSFHTAWTQSRPTGDEVYGRQVHRNPGVRAPLR